MEAINENRKLTDAERVEIMKRDLAKAGRDPLEALLALGRGLPAAWRDWPPHRCLEYLRCRFEFTQQELGEKSGVAQSLISRIEGGAPALLGTWVKLFAAMGFQLSLLPVSSQSPKELQARAEGGRPPGHWLKQRARPRRRWAAYYAQRRREKGGSMSAL